MTASLAKPVGLKGSAKIDFWTIFKFYAVTLHSEIKRIADTILNQLNKIYFKLGLVIIVINYIIVS